MDLLQSRHVSSLFGFLSLPTCRVSFVVLCLFRGSLGLQCSGCQGCCASAVFLEAIHGDCSKPYVVAANATAELLSQVILPMAHWLSVYHMIEQPATRLLWPLHACTRIDRLGSKGMCVGVFDASSSGEFPTVSVGRNQGVPRRFSCLVGVRRHVLL